MRFKRRLRFIWRYLTGDTPWDSGTVPPEIVAWLAQHPVPGRALDLGCGAGTTTIHLARQGWDAVGVDFAPNAIFEARARARREARNGAFAGSLRFLSADVSRPDLLRDVPPFDLLVDVGCLHGVAPDRRAAYAANLARWARPGATLLLYAWMPRPEDASSGPLGIDPDGVRALLGEHFDLRDYTVGQEATRPRPSTWYTLTRIADQSAGTTP